MPLIRTERDGRVLTAIIDNPPHNFLTAGAMDELHELLLGLQDDNSIGAIVLTSALDGIFISHFDVAEISAGTEGLPEVAVSRSAASATLRMQSALERIPGARNAIGKTPAAGVSGLLRFHETCALIQSIDKVVIAAINGRALGGGSELALSCDIRIMADGEFQIGQPEVLLGIIPGGGGTQRLPRAVGPARALELMLDGRPILPAEALEIGYVNYVVAPSEFAEFVGATAQRLARRPRAAVAAIKHAVNGDQALAKGLHTERSAFLAVGSTKAARGAMKAYLAHLDGLEARGEQLTPETLQAWIDGTAFDFSD
ncbi:enoyl-CoA hydratase/isomerase family protein [Antrihabitans stalactiti]|uniref:Enoyl-CoA hydratase/isomerase family protein n=1 Tax=Antrihabitans stalactiti TaxID=2584121 RepID=A0A848KA20_9NOCA|nr:enoyl-CoA hydratase/isomerase family protein [Antrihabitans stalactiti]NMN95189.1 enoyl-CoA hydratase/isomerase family protein [Antrihabitans stalactiti]